MTDKQPFDTPRDLLTLIDTISYFLHLKMHTIERNATFPLPRDVDRIIELARGLPTPRPEEWGSLAVGRISAKRKFGTDGIEENKEPKRRFVWTPASNMELVELVEAEENVDWTSLAQRFGFSSVEPVQRQYKLLAERSVSAWDDHDKSADLIRLVQNTTYRERLLGTQEVAWHAIAAHLGVTERSARDKYREMTGTH